MFCQTIDSFVQLIYGVINKKSSLSKTTCNPSCFFPICVSNLNGITDPLFPVHSGLTTFSIYYRPLLPSLYNSPTWKSNLKRQAETAVLTVPSCFFRKYKPGGWRQVKCYLIFSTVSFPRSFWYPASRGPAVPDEKRSVGEMSPCS